MKWKSHVIIIFLNKSWLIVIGDMLPQVTRLFWQVIPLRNSMQRHSDMSLLFYELRASIGST